MKLNHACPICLGESVHERFVPDWGEMRCCASCELVFANPMTLPESSESFFGKAYQGVLDDPGMEDMGGRILLREAEKKGKIDPEKRRLPSGAQGQAMAWLKKNISPGSVVLDIGCGAGYFLSSLRNNGFTPAGLEVAKEAADMLTNDGFKVWHGTVDSIPADWQNPEACTCFFVLHHVPDPVGFLATIRDKFPNASLLIAVWNRFPSPPDFGPRSLPPRTIAWWGPQSLQRAMEKAGYQVDSVSQRIEAHQFRIPRITQRGFSDWAMSSGHYRLLAIYYAVKPKLVWPWRLWKQLRGKCGSALAIGKPC